MTGREWPWQVNGTALFESAGGSKQSAGLLATIRTKIIAHDPLYLSTFMRRVDSTGILTQ